MRIPVDLDAKIFSRSLLTAVAVSALNVKRGDTEPLEIQFTRAGVVQEMDNSIAIKFGAKVKALLDGSYVVSSYDSDSATWAFTKTGTGESTIYTLNPSWNTVKLNNLLGFDPDGFAQQTDIYTTADVSGSLAAKYFDVPTANLQRRFWFKVAGHAEEMNVDPEDGGSRIEVDIAENATAEDIATAIAAAAVSDDSWTASVDGFVVTLTDIAIGTRSTSSEDGNTGFRVITWITGSSPRSLTNVASVTLACELEWVIGTQRTTTATTDCIVAFDVNQGGEGMTKNPSPAYPAPGQFNSAHESNVAAAGTILITPPSRFTVIHFERIFAADGADAYTVVAVLPDPATHRGTVFISVRVAASENPTIEIRSATVDGSLLLTLPPQPSDPKPFFAGYAVVNGAWREMFAAFRDGDLPEPDEAFYKLADETDAIGDKILTNNGAVDFSVDGKVGKCATFDGTNWLSSAALAAMLSGKSEFSIGMWVKANAPAGNFVPFEMRGGGGDIFQLSVLSSTGEIHPYSNVGSIDVGSGSFITLDGSWQFIWMSLKDEVMTIRCNGDAPATIDPAPATMGTYDSAAIGASTDGSNGWIGAADAAEFATNEKDPDPYYNAGAGFEPA